MELAAAPARDFLAKRPLRQQRSHHAPSLAHSFASGFGESGSGWSDLALGKHSNDAKSSKAH